MAKDRYRITEAEMESRRRRTLIVAELTDAIGRVHEKNSDITCIEVVDALHTAMGRWLALEMRETE